MGRRTALRGTSVQQGRSDIRFCYDGENKVTYQVSDAEGFDFTSNSPATVGWGFSAPEFTGQ